MEGKLSESEIIKMEAKQISSRVGKEGIFCDYFNEGKVIMMYFNLGLPEQELRSIILKRMEEFRSYSEYMDSRKKIGGPKLADSLTPRGREIVVRLDEIAAEIKSLSNVEDPQKLDVKRVLELLEESQTFIY